MDPSIDFSMYPQNEYIKQIAPIRVAVTGATGLIGSYLCPMIASGRMFGPHQRVILHLIVQSSSQKALDGLVMELNDGAYPLLHGIVPTTDLMVGFKEIDVALLAGSKPRLPGM